MRRSTFLFLTIFLFSIQINFDLKAQTNQSFVIINDGAVPNMNEYLNALQQNDLDKYRHATLRAHLEFKSGVHVELLSAYELTQLGIPVDLNKVSHMDEQSWERRFDNSEFELHSSGRILEKISIPSPK